MAIILRLERALGTIDGVNVDFTTPSPYISGSLNIFRNGQLLDQSSENGWTEVDPNAGTFRMKIPPLGPNPGAPPSAGDPGDLIDTVYQDEKTGGGAEGGIPHLSAAQLLRPNIPVAQNLIPQIVASDDPNEVKPPLMTSAENVEPLAVSAVEYKPKMISAKEVP